ncbi:MAG: hypothetical protein H6916_08230 [Novosphingobium sp.]|uniref:hypothetical protein n=1 Tax=Novosphingobium sp. TaxID=1874826 RepID=UPI001D39B464|nr:hypothetical protein [Novosphingobium sp.]MCB2056683.1 hypothetical protein [Novosphingobium sp.]MCP5386789.1 hypothetical protein [Novosphingobium sp.]
MNGLAQILPFAAVAVFTLISIGSTLWDALPAIMRLRGELAHGTEMRTYTYRISETVGRWNDGTVVAFPVRPKARLHRPHAPRAAA